MNKNTTWINSPPSDYVVQRVGDGFCYIHRSAQISSGGTIGRFSYINHSCVVGGKFPVTIGSFCSIAHELYCWTCDGHQTKYVSTFPLNTILGIDIKYSELVEKPDGIVIGNDVWIGSQVRIMPGVKIGNGSVIASRAVVTKDVPPYSIFGGVPGRVIKMRFHQVIIDVLESIAWWNWPVEKLLVNHHFFSLDLTEIDNPNTILDAIL